MALAGLSLSQVRGDWRFNISPEASGVILFSWMQSRIVRTTAQASPIVYVTTPAIQYSLALMVLLSSPFIMPAR